MVHWGDKSYWKVINHEINADSYSLTTETLTTKQFLVSVMRLNGLKNRKVKYSNGQLVVSSKLKVNNAPLKIERLVINNAEKFQQN